MESGPRRAARDQEGAIEYQDSFAAAIAEIAGRLWLCPHEAAELMQLADRVGR
ncbi:MAG TPA: hypothetical protein VHY76_11810 [Acetobacteraceae bacterium]|nr:hypothetical protein [Acetobacteraceae bacterium]